MKNACTALLLFIACVLPASAQEPASVDGVAAFVTRLEEIVRLGDRAELRTLAMAPLTPEDADAFIGDLLAPDVRRAVARERDRAPIPEVPPGDGYRLVIEFFIEIGDQGRLLTARFEVRRPRDGGPESWRISGIERLSLVDGLYRLRLNTTTQYAVRNFTVNAEDLRLTLQDGSIFPVETDIGITGIVLLGRGEMGFTPPSETERGQVRMYSGADALVTSFEGAFVRMNPIDYERQIAQGRLAALAPDPRTVRRADELFMREAPKSFNLDLRDMSSDEWYLIPQQGDFVADISTRRFGTLTYAKNQNQAEDITLFNREQRRTISIYQSAVKQVTRGPHYNEDSLTEFDITAFEIEASIDPENEQLAGRARVTLRSRTPFLTTLTLRLAETLNVSSVISPQFGRLLFLRIRNQNGVLINLPGPLNVGDEIALIVTYSGTVSAQRVQGEALALAQQDDVAMLGIERSYLVSNRSYWYPQNAVNDYATARLRIAVPPGWGVVASGQRVAGNDTTLRDILGPVGPRQALTFVANEPTRYLSLVVSRFVRVFDATITVHDAEGVSGAAPASARTTMALTVDANPRQSGRGREIAGIAEDVLRFYSTVMQDTPYPSMTIALVENDLPGGHSPAYATMLNNPPPASQFQWRNDPAAFFNFPEFFVAHEIAHQWWGQAVGWKNYHEQWISEGFAQYFSALYAQRARGDVAMNEMLRQFRRWALAQSDQGPIYLGYRLGHVKGDSRIFRALIYNKAAGVLHMLRRLVGDDTFFAGLRRFYNEQRFKKAGTDDFQRAMEAESGRSLERFFERYIYGSTMPRIRYSSSVSNGAVVVRFEQLGDMLFDVPVTVTVVHTNGKVTEVMVPVTERRVERTIPVDGAVRQVQVNRDYAALAEIEGS